MSVQERLEAWLNTPHMRLEALLHRHGIPAWTHPQHEDNWPEPTHRLAGPDAPPLADGEPHMVEALYNRMVELERAGEAVWDQRRMDWHKPRRRQAPRLISHFSHFSQQREPLTPADITPRFDQIKASRKPGTWTARCPAHDDRGPSLSILHGDRRWTAHCFAGCHEEDIWTAVGLTINDLWVTP